MKMTDTTYTAEELQQAMRELNYSSFQGDFLKIAEQADKNRAVKQGTGFTEAQVRRAVEIAMTEDGASCNRADKIARATLRVLDDAETVPEPVEGGVYKSPAGVLYLRQGSFWERFGTNVVLNDDRLNYPVSEMERVL